MIYSKDKLIGLSMANAIATLCSSITSAERWGKFQDCIKLSDKHTVSVSDRGYVTRGILVIGGEETSEAVQELAEVKAYAAALQPLFDDLTSGELAIMAKDKALGLSATEFLCPADGWDDEWRIIIEGRSATLIDGKGSEYKLLTVQLAASHEAAKPPRAAGKDTIAKSSIEKIKASTASNLAGERRPRGDTYDDEPYFPMIEKLIAEHSKYTPWIATKDLIKRGVIPVPKTTEMRAVIQRVVDKYVKDDRPKTHQEALRKAPATQK